MKKFFLWIVLPSVVLTVVYSSGYQAGRIEAESRRPVQTYGPLVDRSGQPVPSKSSKPSAKIDNAIVPIGIPKRSPVPEVIVPKTFEEFKKTAHAADCGCGVK
jgi:hypothetical protein